MEAKEPKASPELLKAFKDLGVPKTPQPDLSAELRKMAADIVKPVFWPNSPASDAERRHANAMLKAADRIESDAAEHEKFVADVMHIRGEIEWLDEECRAMRGALKLCLRAMTVATEDGREAWEDAITKAKAALSMPRVVRSEGPGPRMTT